MAGGLRPPSSRPGGTDQQRGCPQKPKPPAPSCGATPPTPSPWAGLRDGWCRSQPCDRYSRPDRANPARWDNLTDHPGSDAEVSASGKANRSTRRLQPCISAGIHLFEARGFESFAVCRCWRVGCFAAISPKKLNCLTFLTTTSKLECIPNDFRKAAQLIETTLDLVHQRLQASWTPCNNGANIGPSPRSSGSGVSPVAATST